MVNRDESLAESRVTEKPVGPSWRYGLNSVRGSLFIARARKNPFLFVFRRREIRKALKPAGRSRPDGGLQTIEPAPPKNKKVIRWFGGGFYKQATPNGVSSLGTHRSLPKTLFSQLLIALSLFCSVAIFAEDYDPT